MTYPPSVLPDIGYSNIGGTGSGFEAPKITVNAIGQITNGTYIIDSVGMAKHMTGSTTSGKS